MQKQSFDLSEYKILYGALPVSKNETLYFDKTPVKLPYSESFPKLHYHDRYEVGICVDGEGLFLSEGIYSSVSKDDLIFISPNQRHYSRSLNTDHPCLCIFAYISPEIIESFFSLCMNTDEKHIFFNSIKDRIPPVIHPSENADASKLLASIIQACNNETHHAKSVTALILTEFLLKAEGWFRRDLPKVQRPHERDELISSICEYISINYNKSDTSKSLAQKCHLSESQLRKRFIAVYGIPPISYRNMLRCKISAELLIQTNAAISEISEKIGYSSLSDFYRAFIKSYGVSPSLYRKTNRQIQ